MRVVTYGPNSEASAQTTWAMGKGLGSMNTDFLHTYYVPGAARGFPYHFI